MEMPMQGDKKLPVFSVRENDLPEVKTMAVGDQVYLLVKAEMIGKNMNAFINGSELDKKSLEGTFNVKSVRVVGEGEVDVQKIEKKEMDDFYGKVRSGYFVE